MEASHYYKFGQFKITVLLQDNEFYILKPSFRTGDNGLPDNNFYSEPGITDTLDIEESVVRVRSVLVQRPGAQIGTRPHRDVPVTRLL
jgi:hypothetical protein